MGGLYDCSYMPAALIARISLFAKRTSQWTIWTPIPPRCETNYPGCETNSHARLRNKPTRWLRNELRCAFAKRTHPKVAKRTPMRVCETNPPDGCETNSPCDYETNYKSRSRRTGDEARMKIATSPPHKYSPLSGLEPFDQRAPCQAVSAIANVSGDSRR